MRATNYTGPPHAPPPPPRQPSPYRALWWIIGVGLAMIFWQPLLFLIFIVAALLTGGAQH